ncbi:MAG: hypothetical protein HY964_05000 [Ignavibacteriales bacterium]|nr:hypothetical protein [Ignavibacteriales bacterium]
MFNFCLPAESVAELKNYDLLRVPLPAGRFVKKPSWFFVKGFFVTRSYTKKDRSCTKKEFALYNTLCR